jgi:septal ring factor EnvC (AmiA/AmiB activator)
MKTLIFSSMVLVGLLLVGLQHQQLRELRAENGSLHQASAEANQLKSDLEKSNGDQAQDEAEIARLREENRDLLKLRGEINQLRDSKAQFEKVSAENHRLQSIAKNAAATEAKQSMQPITIRIDNLFNRGQGTPEDAMQTFFWAAREHNTETLARCVLPESRPQVGSYANGGFKDVISIEIVARRELDADTVQLGISIRMRDDSQSPIKYVMKLSRKDGEWRVDLKSPL